MRTIRIVLNGDDFRTLVSGGMVRQPVAHEPTPGRVAIATPPDLAPDSDETVEIILSDIGFGTMTAAIERAERGRS